MAESRTTGTSVVTLLASVVLVAAVVGIGSPPVSAQQEPDPPVPQVTPETTSTLPSGGELGNIVPRPNSGREPETPGDPGGSQQVALFFVLCFVIAAMVGVMWWRSRVARTTRAAEGHDPVAVATRHGGDVRRPRPPGIVD